MGLYLLCRRLQKWSSKDRADTGVNINLYSSLKCVYEKLRDFIENEGGKEMYTKIGRAHV